MVEPDKEALMEKYFTAVDTESYELFTEVFDKRSRHVRPGQDVLQGREEILEFFETQRRSSGTDHQQVWVYHRSDASYSKVNVSGTIDGEQFEGTVICEFQFGSNPAVISKYRVYRGYDR